MGLFDKIFKPIKTDTAIKGYFQTFNAYSPIFYNRSGGIYEMAQTRAAINTIATHCSKLKAHVVGKANPLLERNLQFQPNPWQTASQFLYRLATILECDNTAFLVPVLNQYDKTVGAYPVVPQNCSLVEGYDGTVYLRYMFATGKYAAVELDRCGIMTKMQYKDDFFGANNDAIGPTLDLMNVQNQGIQEGIKNAASLRFMAKVANSMRPEDLEAEQRRFRNMNLSAENNGGVLLYDTKYAEVKQIESKPYVVDADQMKIINENVYNYFGVNEKLLKNEWDEKIWAAFYEGKVEPFALQLSLVLTKMMFSERERGFGNEIQFSANRLQFATTTEKISMITQLFDRGMLTINEGREILQMEPIEGGDKHLLLAEYISNDERDRKKPDEEEPKKEPQEEPQKDEEYEDGQDEDGNQSV